MSSPAVIPLDDHRRRTRRLTRALAAEALLRAAVEDATRPQEPRTGRAWINGSEVGGTEPRYAHLAESHD
jgi:hypothetical protein